MLKLSTDDAGTIYIEWDKIVAIKTALEYEVVTRNGSRYVGVLAADVADELRVIAEDGAVTRLALPRSRFVLADQLGISAANRRILRSGRHLHEVEWRRSDIDRP